MFYSISLVGISLFLNIGLKAHAADLAGNLEQLRDSRQSENVRAKDIIDISKMDFGSKPLLKELVIEAFRQDALFHTTQKTSDSLERQIHEIAFLIKHDRSQMAVHLEYRLADIIKIPFQTRAPFHGLNKKSRLLAYALLENLSPKEPESVKVLQEQMCTLFSDELAAAAAGTLMRIVAENRQLADPLEKDRVLNHLKDLHNRIVTKIDAHAESETKEAATKKKSYEKMHQEMLTSIRLAKRVFGEKIEGLTSPKHATLQTASEAAHLEEQYRARLSADPDLQNWIESLEALSALGHPFSDATLNALSEKTFEDDTTVRRMAIDLIRRQMHLFVSASFHQSHGSTIRYRKLIQECALSLKALSKTDPDQTHVPQ